MTGYALTETPLGQPLGRESAGLEPKDGRRFAMLGSGNSGRRIVLAIALAIAVLGGSVGMSIWRYQVALDAASQADLAHEEQIHVAEANMHFWHQSETANEYFLGVGEAQKEVEAEAKAFALVTQGLGSDAPEELALVAQARAANVAFVATFKQHLGAYERPAVVNALEALSANERAVLAPLESLQRISAGEAHEAEAAANSAAGQALAVSIIAGLLAVLGGIAFAVFALGLVRRVSQREKNLQDLVGHVRSTLGVLSGVSTELRSSAQEAAAATTEQSAAVAETSATIEELAVTATSIADNARAVAAAAEQTGDTMRDMQEKVETIAERSLSLGERSAEDRRDPRADQRRSPSRRTCSRSTRRSRPPAPARPAAGSRSSPPRCASWPSARCTRPSRSARSSPRSRTRPTRRSWPPSRARGRRARSAS